MAWAAAHPGDTISPRRHRVFRRPRRAYRRRTSPCRTREPRRRELQSRALLRRMLVRNVSVHPTLLHRMPFRGDLPRPTSQFHGGHRPPLPSGGSVRAARAGSHATMLARRCLTAHAQ